MPSSPVAVGMENTPAAPAQAPAATPAQTQTSPAAAEPTASLTNEPTPAPSPLPISELVASGVYPNESGQIMIIMYHGIAEDEPGNVYRRTEQDFRKDLQALYDRGYRLIPISDLFDNNIKTAAGYSPLVLSFDDGLSSAFSLREEGGGLALSEGCAVDILTEFAWEHPDFGNTAVFYINGGGDPFKGAGTLPERLAWLVAHGYELGNHTYSHGRLDKLDAEGVQEEIGKVEQIVRGALPGYSMRSLSYPLGVRPDEEFRGYALAGEYGGVKYAYSWALREGQSGASAAPNNVLFDPLNIPRVRGSEGEETDLWWTVETLDARPERRYVSDGDPGRIAVPEEQADKINKGSLNGKELAVYSGRPS